MGITSTSLTVTIVTRTAEGSILEAEIVDLDNNGESTYYVDEKYYLRLYKSPDITSVKYNSNIGTVSLTSSGLTASVPYKVEDPEYLIFTGGETSDLDKVYESGFSYSQMGSVYDSDGNPTSATLAVPSRGYKTVVASKKIFGVYNVTYTTKYDKYRFSSGTKGPMLIFFIGYTS